MADQNNPPNQLMLAAEKEVETLGKKFDISMPGSTLAQVLISTAFSARNEKDIPSPEQMIALMVVSRQYGLNPFTKEIYAFPDKNKGIIPIVSVDGWTRIINEHPQMNGLEFRFAPDIVTIGKSKPCPEWCEAIIYRKDRDKPIIIREYLDELYQPPRNNYDGPWQSHTKRMMRHKTLIQTARIAFGFAGIHDPDEGERILEARQHEDGTYRVDIEGERQAVSTQRKAPARPSRKKVEQEPQTEHQDAQSQKLDDQPPQGEQGDPGPQPEDAQFEEVDEQQDNGGQADTSPQASEGAIAFICQKGNQRGYAPDDLAKQFGLESLNGISEEKAGEILRWIKTAPDKNR